MRNEYLKAVVWPRGPMEKEGKKIYRYAIIGMLITDVPLENLEGKNEIIVEGYGGIGQNLDSMPQRGPKMATGDAVNVLLSLDML